jgi:hypothetical protein
VQTAKQVEHITDFARQRIEPTAPSQGFLAPLNRIHVLARTEVFSRFNIEPTGSFASNDLEFRTQAQITLDLNPQRSLAAFLHNATGRNT